MEYTLCPICNCYIPTSATIRPTRVCAVCAHAMTLLSATTAAHQLSGQLNQSQPPTTETPPKFDYPSTEFELKELLKAMSLYSKDPQSFNTQLIQANQERTPVSTQLAAKPQSTQSTQSTAATQPKHQPIQPRLKSCLYCDSVNLTQDPANHSKWVCGDCDEVNYF